MKTALGSTLIAFALLIASHPAHPHGIAGNRFFAGTLVIDDPAVNDEAVLPYSYLGFAAEGGKVTENRIAFAFARLLTPTLAITVDSGWIHQNWPQGRTSGFDTTEVGLKYEAYRNNQHETLVSVGLAWGIAHSGAQRVGADGPNASFGSGGTALAPDFTDRHVRIESCPWN